VRRNALPEADSAVGTRHLTVLIGQGEAWLPEDLVRFRDQEQQQRFLGARVLAKLPQHSRLDSFSGARQLRALARVPNDQRAP
jgi:hypothetical protein